MKVAFVSPAMGKVADRPYVKTWTMEPLGIAVLSSLTPSGIERICVDDRYEDPLLNPELLSADLIAMPVETYTAQRAYFLSSNFRQRGIPVVLGGIQASLDLEEVAANASSVVVGDAEKNWQILLDDFSQSQLKQIYNSDRAKRGELAQTIPDRTIYSQYPYTPIRLLETGRGCIFKCDFCAIAGNYNGGYRSKQIDKIVEEVATTPAKFYYFVDDNFVSDFARTRDLGNALANLNIHWFSQGSINMADDNQLLKALERSGCTNILVGFESLNDDVLRAMGKGWNVRKRTLKESIEKIHDAGITLYGTFVFGYDQDTPDAIKRTLEFAIESKLNLASFNHLVPFPGTPLYKRFKEEGRLLRDKWWLDSGSKFGEVTFQPKHMSPETLSKACFDARVEFYNVRSIISRVMDFNANSKNLFNTFMSLYVNFMSRRGVVERQKWPIGRVESNDKFTASIVTR